MEEVFDTVKGCLKKEWMSGKQKGGCMIGVNS